MMLLFWRATHSVSMFPAEMTEAERKRALLAHVATGTAMGGFSGRARFLGGGTKYEKMSVGARHIVDSCFPGVDREDFESMRSTGGSSLNKERALKKFVPMQGVHLPKDRAALINAANRAY